MNLRMRARAALVVSVAGALVLGAGTVRADAITGQVDIVGPAGSGAFGRYTAVLPNGNVVITDPGYDLDGTHTDVGAAYLYSGVTHQVISTLRGSTTGDQVGGDGVTVLTNGNYVIRSTNWTLDGTHTAVGAVTWGSATTGVSGTVSAANSLIGSTTDDKIGLGGVTALTNGNYVVVGLFWDLDGTHTNVGAVTWGNGATGIKGAVSSANSLVGATTDDKIGSYITPLTNGNYVVSSSLWDLDGSNTDVGAVTWGNGATGGTRLVGPVTVANSLTGSQSGDKVGSNRATALTNGNFVALSPNWANGGTIKVGAVTWGSGTSGVTGTVSNTNSLVGSTANDQVGYYGITLLTNGNYVVRSNMWDLDGTHTNVGAVTWGNGSTGTSGTVSAANSLVGATTNDSIGGNGIFPLTNGNYVVASGDWSIDASHHYAGAVTWGNGSTGTSGTVSAANSLVGSVANDDVGVYGIVALTNGNYVAVSPYWALDGTHTNVGAVTWSDGSIGGTRPLGAITAANSLIGSTGGDHIGNDYVIALTNGNYVVASADWDLDGAHTDVGAVTWGNGATGTTGAVSSANSLVGSTSNDKVGTSGLVALTSGNYVVASKYWDLDGSNTDVGAATWGNGATGGTRLVGPVTAANSLIGSTSGQQVGSGGNNVRGVLALTNGNYLVRTDGWDLDGTHTNVGAVTWGNGATGTTGTVSAANSLVGSTTNDKVGWASITALTDGNYLIQSTTWDLDGSTADSGAVTWGNGSAAGTRPVGPVTSTNSILGTVATLGYTMLVSYDYAYNQVVVARFSENIVTWLAVAGYPELPPTGGNVDLFLWVGASLLAAGALLHGTQRRLRFARNG